MPLVGSYNWTEKSDKLIVSIPLKGCAPSKVDIFCTSSTLKVNYSPYIVDLVLHGTINAVKHKATVKEGTLQITLFKAEPISDNLWGKLIADEESRDEIRANAAIAHEALQKELDEQRKGRRVDDERFSLRKQMSLEESERSRLENVKAEEKSAAEEVMYQTFREMQVQQQKADASTPSSASSASAKNSTISPIVKQVPNKSIFDTVLDADDIDDDELEGAAERKDCSPLGPHDPRVEVLGDNEQDSPPKEKERGNSVHASKAVETNPSHKNDIFSLPPDCSVMGEEEADADVKFIPPPRSILSSDSHSAGANVSTKIGISFTPRVFPTPMRESKAAEEEDWVMKNRRHLKNHSVLGKGMVHDVSEEDPSWLKGKGDDFFRGGDTRSAINAYTASIDADPTMTSCYSNRSACYLKLGLYAECKADCTSAIKHMDAIGAGSGPQQQQLSAMAAKDRSTLHKLLLRRGVASCHLGDHTAAIEDHSRVLAAVEALHSVGMDTGGVAPSGVFEDLRRLRMVVEVDALKKEGDVMFSERRVGEALEKYSAALALLPFHVSCMSNRSACKLALADLEGCVEDCTNALDLLQLDPNLSAGTAGGINMIASILPPPGSEKRLAWITRTMARRGQALVQLGRHAEAVSDYEHISSLNPTNETLRSDLEMMKKHHCVGGETKG